MRKTLLLFILIALLPALSHADDVDDRLLRFRQLYRTDVSQAFKQLRPVDDPRIVDELAKVYKEKGGPYSLADVTIITAKGQKVFDRIHSYVSTVNAESVRTSFVKALGKLAKPESLDVILRYVERERSEAVQYQMVIALASYSGTRVYDALFSVALKSQAYTVSLKATTTLSQYKAKKAAKLLKSIYNKGRLPEGVRAEALFGLLKHKLLPLKELVEDGLEFNSGPILMTAIDGAAKLKLVSAASRLIQLLRHRKWQVRLAAINACGAIRLTEAVEPLIELWKREDGRLGEDIHAALLKITGKSFGPLWQAWESWFEGLEEPLEPADKAGEYISYHGTKTRSKNICFCIDTSGSMSSKVKDHTGGYVGEGETVEEMTRLEMVKLELIRVVKSLPRDAYFNIIAFETNLHEWRDKQTRASRRAKSEAESWIRSLNHTGGTNMYDAIIEALGQGKKDYRKLPDTMFVLSDGTPAMQGFESRDEMLADIARRNRLSRVKIHTIGVGISAENFLKPLAEQNEGVYRLAAE